MIMSKPVLLFYCQHSLGMGHLMRACHLVRQLTREFRVVFLNGGPIPEGVPMPAEAEIVNLPPLGMDEDSALISRDGNISVEQAQAERKALILALLEAHKPAAVVIELFPFGRKKFAFELLPLLKTIQRMDAGRRPRVLCSLRDIIVGGRKDQLRHDNRAAWLINRYFDGVLLHSDPAFARLEESFHPSLPLRKPLLYTGFVAPEAQSTDEPQGTRQVLISAGGGIVGGGLYNAAIDAHALLWPELALPMTIVAGPFLPEEEWRSLQQRAAGIAGLTLLRSVPKLGALMREFSCSVSQCGYNTAMDLMQAGIPALVVPFSEGDKDEQMNRARRLEQLGLLRVLEAGLLCPGALATEIRRLQTFRPATSALNFNGAEDSLRLVRHLVNTGAEEAANQTETSCAA
jgi:predicted glycosyltransferase